ncbi:uncharacterized protein LOC107797846 isoform X4 [Nicotiana tabacum]|uniref:Uncharacterized protein LOC107797846 isoform X4 n=1 Tax=Nicotiana tabacum TaxID=4097 RepID=A0AC58RS33_TOBAC
MKVLNVGSNGWKAVALAKAQQLLLDPQERDYILNQVNAAKGPATLQWSEFNKTVSAFVRDCFLFGKKRCYFSGNRGASGLLLLEVFFCNSTWINGDCFAFPSWN